MHITRELKKTIRDLGEVGQWLWMKGWAEQNAGNISVDVSDLVDPLAPARRCLLVTVAGSRMRDIKKAPEKNLMLIRLLKTGRGYRVLWGGADGRKSPTSELSSHLTVHAWLRQRRMSQKVFLHTHPTHLIALTHLKKYAGSSKALNDLLVSVHPEVVISLPEGLGLAPYRRPGSKGLSAATIAELERHRVVVWEKHGCAAIGNDIYQAFDLIDLAEKAAGIYLLCRASAHQFQGLNIRQIRNLKNTFKPVGFNNAETEPQNNCKNK